MRRYGCEHRDDDDDDGSDGPRTRDALGARIQRGGSGEGVRTPGEHEARVSAGRGLCGRKAGRPLAAALCTQTDGRVRERSISAQRRRFQGPDRTPGLFCMAPAGIGEIGKKIRDSSSRLSMETELIYLSSKATRGIVYEGSYSRGNARRRARRYLRGETCGNKRKDYGQTRSYK